MDARRAAALVRPFGLLAAILMATVAGAGPSALANDTPGNNATVKIHEGPGENDPGEVRNEPHVCTFHLHFYFADPEQAGTWEIQAWAPTGAKGTVVKAGTYDTAGDGEDRQPATGVYTLPDGHYKLFWDGDLDTGKHDKMKVFWVDCAPASAAPSESAAVPSGSELPIGSGSAAPSTAPSSQASTAPSTLPSSPTGSEAPIASGSPSAGAGGSTPTGNELPIEGVPTGEVAGLTPPPTDADVAPAAGNDGWRVVLMALAAIIAAAVFLARGRTAADVMATTRHRRGR